MSGEASDESLLAAAAAGDQGAWDELTARYLPLLWTVARSHRLDDGTAADVVQTTWLRLVENLGRLREPSRVRAWLVTVCRRESLREVRRHGRVGPTLALDADDASVQVPSHAPTPEEAVLSDAQSTAVRAAFDQLGDRCRILLTLVCASPGLSYAEVSDELDMPVGSIGPTRARCLQKLRGLLPARINEH